MDLEIVGIYSQNWEPGESPENFQDFYFPINVEIGEENKAGSELFHFVVVSPLGLQGEVKDGEFKHLRGLISINKFDWKVVNRAINNLLNHSRHLETWDKVIEFWSRYGRYDSEDL